MSLAKVLIKFMGPNPACNVISAAALEPEILIPVGYGSFLTDTMRSRYNFFFHRRQLQTIVSEPVSLERYLLGDIENKIESLLGRYESRQPVVDITDADPLETMALGSVLKGHKFWSITVLDSSLKDGVFLPLKNGDYLKQLSFPSLTAAEYAYLRDGIVPDEKGKTDQDLITRKDLTRDMVLQIQALSTLYAESPAYWRDNAARLEVFVGGSTPDKTEFVIDTSSCGIRDTAFEDMRDIGLLRQMEIRSGIVRMIFRDRLTLRLFLRIERIPLVNVFLSVAMVRAYGKTAAYHDLVLHDFRYITCFREALPVVIMLYDEREDKEQIYRFHAMALSLFEEPVRKILVRFVEASASYDVENAAKRFGVELVPVQQLASYLEPK